MHENIQRPLPTGQEAESAQPVEPFDLRPFQTAGRRHADVSPRRQHLRRMDRGRFVHREDPERLIALGALDAFAYQPRPLVSRLKAIAPEHCDVQQHIGPAVIRNDEAVALRGIEPFDNAGDFDEVGRGLAEARQCLHCRIARSARIFACPKAIRSGPTCGNPDLLGLKSVRPHNPGLHTSSCSPSSQQSGPAIRD